MYTANDLVLPAENRSHNVITQLAFVIAIADEQNSAKEKTICALLHGAGNRTSSLCTRAAFVSRPLLTPLNTTQIAKQKF